MRHTDQSVIFQACDLSIDSRRLVLTTWMYLSVVSFFLCPRTSCKPAMGIPLLTLWALNVCRRVCTPDFLTPSFVKYFLTNSQILLGLKDLRLPSIKSISSATT